MVAGPIASMAGRQEVDAVFFLSPSSVMATIEKAMQLKASLSCESSASSEVDEVSSVAMSEEESLKYDIEEIEEIDTYSIDDEDYSSIPEEVLNTTSDDWATAAFKRILAVRSHSQ